MVMARICAIGAWAVCVGMGGASSTRAEGVVLRESGVKGSTTKVVVEMKAEGMARPAGPPTLAGAAEGKPLKLRVEARFAFDERVLQADGSGAAIRTLRQVRQAAAAINGEVRSTAPAIRPGVTLLVAERREGSVITFSPSGPLTRSELELVQGPGDPLALAALLTDKPVAVGDRWTVGPPAARSLSGYDALAANGLEATLEDLDEKQARIALAGTVRGAVLGGEGTMSFEGTARFDREAGRVAWVSLGRSEVRKAGPVEPALDVQSTLTVDRRSIEAPPELADAVADAIPPGRQPALEELLFVAPDAKYHLRHDRDWHLFAEDVRQVVLKRLDRGEPVAQCNLVVGPKAGKGRHQDLGQFRDDIKAALKQRFGRVLDAGEVEGSPGGGFRYRVAVQGTEGEVGLLWFYYLIAGPEGDQLLGTFTLGAGGSERFGDQDLRLIGSLEWGPPDEGR